MPFITQAKLEIEEVGRDDLRRLNVDCQFKFVGVELLSKAWFRVKFFLVGWDGDYEDPGRFIRSDCVQATEQFVSHHFSQNVLTSSLNEDVFGTDEVFIRVKLEPWIPRTVSANTNLVTGQW